MKRFRFSLQAVAVLRAHREAKAREALAAAIQAYARSEAQVAAVQARLAELNGVIGATRRGTRRAADEAAFLQSHRRECAAEQEAQRQRQAALAALEQRRADYLAANRQVKQVAKLEERARAAHRLAVLRAEQVLIDEIANRRLRHTFASS